MEVRPISDRVLVTRVAKTEISDGGIIIPDAAREKPLEGTVAAVGPGKTNKKGDRSSPEVKKGDNVLFGKYAGSEVNIDGVEYLILKEDDILGIIEK